ncbi:hypothetical protein [[Clostridium] fimetarium]|uniref:Uncharacterized protein n=1 Tax=[Clostridium] fimetarium TaxID=99656 RepID=A0A1I0R0I9_9FIRM|nr:hypothetical protein [[Clostridium] fimetarium]SEW33561.1 hypothetical protein SAMN05421659_110132 [[Clostridium] fimetarium]
MNKRKEDSDKRVKTSSFQTKKSSRKTMFIVLGAVFISIIVMINVGQIIIGLLSFKSEEYSTTDISNYGVYEGHVRDEKAQLRSGLFIFPKELSVNAKNIEFLYSCRVRGLGLSYQQFLKCTYSDQEYRAEIDRLKSIKCEINTKNGTKVNYVEYSDTKFNYPAYIAAYGGNRIFEYAIFNEDIKTITYIYIQIVSNNDVAFSKEYLPIEYQNEKQLLDDDNLDNKNIYYTYLGYGVYKGFKD